MQIGPYFLSNLHHITIVFLSHAHMHILREGEIQQIQTNPTEKEGQTDRKNIRKYVPLLEHTYCSPVEVSLPHNQIFPGG